MADGDRLHARVPGMPPSRVRPSYEGRPESGPTSPAGMHPIADLDARQAWARQVALEGGASCVVCHLAGYGPRNRYGTAINMLQRQKR